MSAPNVVHEWTCARCARSITVIRCDPDWKYGENILPPGEPDWEWVADGLTCGGCLTDRDRMAAKGAS